jgi:hypothetical protein
MATTAHPPNPEPKRDSPYCSDPNCQSCKVLRETHEQVRTGRPIPRSDKRSS